MSEEIEDSEDIAIIGMACRFPKSNTPEEFWSHLLNAEELIQKVGKDNPKEDYIASKGCIENFDYFDADVFQINPREAKLIDPQQRILLECAWECLEDACYNPEYNNQNTGVFVGANTSQYFLHHLLPLIKAGKLKGQDEMLILVNNANDYLATKLAYTFNLIGPSISLQSACSTSLLAIYQACQALLSYQCDQALAGGASITLPNYKGYHYTPNSIYSADGHCRPFDHLASGTVFGDGGALVLLKRLSDAIREKDNIHAVIKASVTNNDGNQKANFFTPSREGQSRAISEAIAFADIPIDSIGYIETHGTGTQIGDPIEINALKDVFMNLTQKKQFCAIGSVKSNIGHLNAAAGIAGLFKTVFCLKNKIIPPTLNFEKENPYLDLENSPFYIVSRGNKIWETTEPAIAGLSSFGIGGTNVHLILQESSVSLEKAFSNQDAYLIPVSAHCQTALKELIEKFINKLNSDQINLAEMSHALQVGRKAQLCRKSFVTTDIKQLITSFTHFNKSYEATSSKQEKKYAWCFPRAPQNIPTNVEELFLNNPLLKKNWLALIDRLPEEKINLQDRFSLLQITLALSLIEIGVFPDKIFVEDRDSPIGQILNQSISVNEGICRILNKTKSDEDISLKYPTYSFENLSDQETTTINIFFDLSFFRSSDNQEKAFLELLSAYWDMGFDINFQKLYGSNSPQKISLPTYPFQRKRHWIELENVKEDTSSTNESIVEMNTEHEAVQSKVLIMFKTSLELDEIDPDLDFFSLGGDSLLALEIADQIRATFDLEIELKNVFSNFSVNGISEHILSNLKLPIN